MAEFVGPFFEDGELILGECRFTKPETEYLKRASIEEARRTLADIGAAAVLVEGRRFDSLTRLIIKSETLPLGIGSGETIHNPGEYVDWGIGAAQVARDYDKDPASALKARGYMDEVGLTAHIVEL